MKQKNNGSREIINEFGVKTQEAHIVDKAIDFGMLSIGLVLFVGVTFYFFVGSNPDVVNSIF